MMEKQLEQIIALGFTFQDRPGGGFMINGNCYIRDLHDLDLFLDGAREGQRTMRDRIVHMVHKHITKAIKKSHGPKQE